MYHVESVKKGLLREITRIRYEAYLAQLDELGNTISEIDEHPEWDAHSDVQKWYDELHQRYTALAWELKKFMLDNNIPGHEMVKTKYGRE